GLGDITATITNGTDTVNLTNCSEITSNDYRGATCTFPGGLAMGYYNVKLTSSWHSATYTLTNGFRIRDYRTLNSFTYMQDIPNSDVCENTPEATSTGANIVTLKDSRDQKQYKIAHLADGNCWMVQNLALDGGRTLHTTDSNVTQDRVLPANISDNTANQLDRPQIYSGGATTTNSYGSPYGNLYNWNAATATLGNSSTPPASSIYESVCPKGWALPNPPSGNRSWPNLMQHQGLPSTNTWGGTDGANAVSSAQQAPLYMVLAGDYWYGNRSNATKLGHVWANTAIYNPEGSVNTAYYIELDIPLKNFLPSGVWYSIAIGFSVRCVFGS
ncbi:hypothetical protein IKG16_02595, partial [Candidatus Saccharibacteria bacterium]|nr:hypothetical protein [Candidatus Saccharibacteria bacterium]